MGTEMERSKVRAVEGVEEAEPTPARVYVAEPVKGEYTRPEWHRWAVSTIDALRFALHGALGRYRISGRSLIERELMPEPERWLSAGPLNGCTINPDWARWADGNMEYWYGRALSAADLLKRTLTQCSFVELPVGERLRTLVERFLGVTTEGAMGEDRTVADLRHELETLTRDRDAANLSASEAYSELAEQGRAAERLESLLAQRSTEFNQTFETLNTEREYHAKQLGELRAKLDEAMTFAQTMTAQRNEARASLDASMGRTRVLSRLLWQAHGVMLNTAPMVVSGRAHVLTTFCERIAKEVGHTPTEGDTSMGLPTDAKHRAEQGPPIGSPPPSVKEFVYRAMGEDRMPANGAELCNVHEEMLRTLSLVLGDFDARDHAKLVTDWLGLVQDWAPNPCERPEMTQPFGERETEPLFVGSSSKASKLEGYYNSALNILEAVCERGDELAEQLSPKLDEVIAWRKFRPNARAMVEDCPEGQRDQRETVLGYLRDAALKRAEEQVKALRIDAHNNGRRIVYLEGVKAEALERIHSLARAGKFTPLCQEMAAWAQARTKEDTGELPF